MYFLVAISCIMSIYLSLILEYREFKKQLRNIYNKENQSAKIKSTIEKGLSFNHFFIWLLYKTLISIEKMIIAKGWYNNEGANILKFFIVFFTIVAFVPIIQYGLLLLIGSYFLIRVIKNIFLKINSKFGSIKVRI